LARIVAVRGDVDGANRLVERAAWLRHRYAETTRAWVEAQTGAGDRSCARAGAGGVRRAARDASGSAIARWS